jgi:hypothetical protein
LFLPSLVFPLPGCLLLAGAVCTGALASLASALTFIASFNLPFVAVNETVF